MWSLTGIRHSLRLLKISIFFLWSTGTVGQEWGKTGSIDLRHTPVSSSVDSQGNIFLGYAGGSLIKYNPSGKVLENFSLANNSSITSIDVQNNLKPFLFYFDIQQITILDRFSSVPKNYSLTDFGVQIGMMSCPAPDGDFWVLENNPQRLKKINPLRKTTVIEVQLSLGDTISRMQAFSNLLVIGDENGLHIYDQFGGFIQTIKIKDIINFQVVDEEVLVFSEELILKIDPYKGRIVDQFKHPLYGLMLKTKDGFGAISNKTLTFYKFIESK